MPHKMTMSRSSMFAALRSANRVAERPFKNRLRAWCLTHVRHALPRELMIRSGDCVVQVGMNNLANIERLSQCVGPGGRAILVEADDDNVRRAHELLDRRKLSNIDVVHAGAWSKKTTLQFKIAEDPDDNRLDRDGVSMPHEMGRDIYSETRTIDVDQLDCLLADRGITTVDYLEVTVNGAELEVLRGAESVLNRTRRVFTAGRARLPDGGPINRAICKFLQERGFETIVTLASPSALTGFGPAHGEVFGWRHVRL